MFKRIFGACAGVSLAYALSQSVYAQPDPAPADGSGSSAPAPAPAASSTNPTGDASDRAGSADASLVGTTGGDSAGTAAPPAAPSTVASEDIAAVPDAAAEVIEIDDAAPAESASSVHLGRDDLGYRSRTQISDILRQVPGLMVSQHAGGGKSDQYFIRGFDADHGTDIAIYTDGIPVNMPSHGHGQGYADTHFLIPETIATVDVHKGPYAARFGDFYTAGAMELRTLDSIAAPTLWVAGGVSLGGPRRFERYNRRLVGMASPQVRDNESDRSLIAVQVADSDGPFVSPQGFRQGNALVKWRGEVGRGELKLATSWYAAKWNASGQVPESAVADGMISRFGSLDPTEGGDTSRTSAQIGYSLRDTYGGTWQASAYLLEYRLRLFSNFTLFARDPVHGDEIEQSDSRVTWGLDAGYSRRLDLAGMDSLVTAGVQLRSDNVDNALWHAERRMRLATCFAGAANPCNHTMDRIRDIAAYAEANIHVLPHVHVLPGLRFEQFVWDVDDLDPETQTDPSASRGGSAGRAILLPKLSVEIEATDKLNVFANAGSGFHSNDARSNAAGGGQGALARALGAEAGVRTTLVPRARISADVWYLHLDSELVWSGDAGGTEPSGSTRRYGVDIEAAYQATPWLRLDGTLGLARSTLVQNAGNSNGLALAPKLIGQGGVTLGDSAQFVALRARGIADRPGNDDGSLTAEGYLIFDLMAGRKFGKLDVNLTVNNLLNSDWREAQFADESRIMSGGDVVEQMHFTPGIPLTATLTAAYAF